MWPSPPRCRVAGVLRVPGDKSISHRYALLAAIADGRSTIANYAPGADCASTLACVGGLGAMRLTNPRAGRGRTATGHHRRARPPWPARRAGAARLRQLGQHHADARRRGGGPPVLIDPDRRCFTVAPADAPHHRSAHPDGRRGHGRSRRPPAGDHSRRRSRRYPVLARDAQRPGQIRRVACWIAGERRDRGHRACLYSRSYGTCPCGVRRHGADRGPPDHLAGRPAAHGP